MAASAPRRKRRLRRLRLSENQTFALLAIVVGLAGGLAAVGFHHLIEFLTDDVFGTIGEWSDGLGRFRVLPPIVIGALLVGPLVNRLASEAKGHGVPEVMEAVSERGGRIRPRVAWVKALASALTIGSGGSAGREGPIVQIGSAIGSIISRWFRMSDRRRSTFVASGAAAGVAAVFNAPLAGVFFALEVILRSFTARGFSTVVISAVTANAVWRVLVGDDAVLTAKVFQLEEPVELIFYGFLGVAAALVAIVFVKVLYLIEDSFEASPIPADLRPAVGAVIVGVMGAISLDLLGSGLEGIDKALAGEFAVRTLLLLLAGKMLATAFTLGSGSSGGIFSPSLFLGALLGSAYGELVNTLFPDTAAPVGAYAVVGMAAVFAAAAQAPMSSIFIVFEMTNDFGLIMPLMLACAGATVVYSALQRDSIYGVKLRRKRVQTERARDRNLMESVPLVRAAEAKYVASIEWRTVGEIIEILDTSREDALLVVSPDRALRGVVFREDAEAADRDASVRAVIRDHHPIGRPDDTLEQGMQKLEDSNSDVLPVVDWNDRVLGVANRFAIVRAYEAAVEAARVDD